MYRDESETLLDVGHSHNFAVCDPKKKNCLELHWADEL